ncbi:MAG: archaeosine biosynthesis radical SAM protein RaSEA [Methanoregula sp.]|uniref:archaeosine biosynthesis radical SAM protein RaSEA n=1 Tax=Methanoregula sp. TaxID=2052170 RepID=UPI0025F50139|nr:archaeosine biosynthesis radical SAM protein RaSEA [Methanoregula sp.]MCK9631933.1 archaeosine biosynthesis radical SAM protein RaSEA [Methanoregula sp.]
MISELPEKPLACWRGKERYGNELLDCLTIIFKSGGCSWSKCRMCSYRHERYGEQSCDALLSHLRAQLAWVARENKSEEYRMVKIFTSGSFFDPAEVPPAFLADVAGAFRGKLVIAETRPEFVQEDTFRGFIEGIDDGTWKTPLYCAIGLETSSDTIREKCINKGFSFSDFTIAAKTAHAAGAGVKAYLLLKPLFLTEREAAKDMETTVQDVVPHAEMISMNPCTVQRNTELEFYWKRGAYRPPYLWTVLTLLKNSPVHMTCDPLGGGQKRGPHNCGTCDYELVSGIRDYSLNGDRDLIGALLETECGCRAEWEYVLAREKPYCMPLTR